MIDECFADGPWRVYLEEKIPNSHFKVMSKRIRETIEVIFVLKYVYMLSNKHCFRCLKAGSVENHANSLIAQIMVRTGVDQLTTSASSPGL